MNEVYILEHEFLFKTGVYEITSISVEHNYDVNDGKCSGQFIIEGDYRLHEVSLNKEDFTFRIPFNNEVRSNVNLESVELEITDFTYECIDDLLNVRIEYQIRGEQNLVEFINEEDFDDFIAANEVEVVDLGSDERTEEEILVEEEDETTVPVLEEPAAEIPVPFEPPQDLIDETLIRPQELPINEQSLMSNINAEESFITYHVHTVMSNDTLESIANAYNVSASELKELNAFDELTLGMKLIIPDETD